MTRPALPVPSERAVRALLACTVLGLGLAVAGSAAWPVAPALGAVVLGLVLTDAALAGGLRRVEVIAPGEVAIGAAADVVVRVGLGARAGTARVALAVDPRLAEGGRLEGDCAGAEARLRMRPSRRGTGAISRAWVRWTGPLGLGARAAEREVDAQVRVIPDLAGTRDPAIRTLLRQSQEGLIARRLKGEGTMFEALADYQPGMDRRRIDWKASARHATLYAKEYEAERNNQIVLAFDCSRAMCEPVAGMTRLDRMLNAGLAIAWVALKGGDRVSLFGFAGQVLLATPFGSAARDFHGLQMAAAGLDYGTGEANFTLALASLSARLQRRSLVLVFSEFTDPAGAELMLEALGRLVRHHRVVFVTLADEELEGIVAARPETVRVVAAAVGAGALLRQRALVHQRLRGMGVEVVEAAHGQVGTRLLDRYLAIRRAEGIG